MLGLGSMLLIIWRFAPLDPGLARIALWEVATCALVVGLCGAASTHIQTGDSTASKDARICIIAIGAALVIARLAMAPFFHDAKVILSPVAQVLIYAGLFTGRSWKIQAPLLAVLGYVLLAGAQDPMSFNAFSTSIMFLGMVIVALLPHLRSWGMRLGIAFAGIGFIALGYIQLRSAGSFDIDPFFSQGYLAFPLALGVGLLLLAMCAALPPVGLLVNVAKHSATLYFLAVLATLPHAESSVEADFGWSMYTPLSGATHTAVDPFAIFKMYGDAFPNWWLLGIGVLACVFTASRRTWGPLETMFTAAYRRF